MEKTTSTLGLIACVLAIVFVLGPFFLLSLVATADVFTSMDEERPCAIVSGSYVWDSTECNDILAGYVRLTAGVGFILLLLIGLSVHLFRKINRYDREEREKGKKPVVENDGRRSPKEEQTTALAILKERFARGEITEDQYLTMKQRMDE